MKKQLLLFLMALLPVVASAYDAYIDGIYYNFSGNEAMVTSNGDCSYSGSVVIPASVTYNNKAYSVTSIGDVAFNNCQNLTSIIIPNSVTSIGDKAFCDCRSLTSITLPNGLTRINVGTFWASGLTSICIPEGVTSIEQDAFNDCRSLKAVTLPNSLTNIGGAAFYACSGITNISIPNNVESIGGYAFYNCSSLTSLILPEGVETIENNMFGNCSKLASIKIPSSLKRVKTGAFSGCTSLNKVIVPDIAAWCGIIYDGDDYTADFPLGRAHHLYSDESTEITEVVIPEGVTKIEPRAFRDAEFITSVTLPNTLSNIDAEAFRGMRRLTLINIPNSVTNIEKDAFRDCSSLTSITFGNGVKSIGNSAFNGCSNLQKVIVPDIAAWCGINFSISKSDTSYYIGTNPLEYSQHLYSDETTEITQLVIPEGVTSIGEGHFFGCSGLISVTIPNSVTSIGRSAFNRCTSLTSVTIPNSVTSIDRYAFYNCSDLTKVYCYAEILPQTSSLAFYESKIASATLYVPASSLELYKTTSPWSEFGEIQPIPKYSLTYIVDGEVYQTYEVEYGSTITPEEAPTKEGYTFSGWSEIPATMPAHDVVVTGTFTVNSYFLFYVLEGSIYKAYNIQYGSKIVPEEVPEKEGYSFSGWVDLPETMPAHDVTVQGQYTINSYTLTYMVDGEEYKSETLVYGTEIVPEEEPSKEGYTFSGWSEIPETMPARDVVVTGSFNVNSYTLSYIVDGEVYKTYEVEYGSAITPEAEPTKAGYTFSGWSEIPETMPAHDVEVTGSFTMILATGIALDKESLLFNSIDAQKLNVTLTPADPYNKTVNWSSTDTDVAIVDEEGLVTPVGNGEAYIIVSTTDGTDLEARCMVTVDFKASILSLDKEEVTIAALESLKLNASVTPDKASQEVTWSSSNTSVVTVSETGTITPLRNGEATITATTTDGTELTATCKVTVDIPSLFEVAVTQTTLTIQSKSDTSEARNIKATIEGEEYDLGDEGKLTGLAPGRAYHIEVTADIEGYTWTEELDVTMAEIAVNFDCKTSPTTLDISASFDAGDATVTSASFEGEEETSTLNLIGLEPAQTYNFIYNIVTEEGGTYTYKAQYTTEALTLAISQTKVVSVGNVVVVAGSNIAEEENVNVGFEWRRYDWPDEIETRTGGAYIYAGTIEGSIKNLNADRFWKIRPYFLSQAGNRFLGDWVTIDPSDVSYFEPSVHTYNSISVEGNTAEVKGFVMQGSDDVESQGFMYWENTPSSSSRKNANGVPDNAKVVKANGNMMVASLENLEFETQYCYVAFVKTSGNETFYGEQQTFKTGEMDPDGIKDIEHSPLNIEHSEGAVYNLAGQKMVNGQPSMVNGKLPRGINIIRYPDGTSKKVLVK